MRSVLLRHVPTDWQIPHQFLAEDGTYLAGFTSQGKALSYAAERGWKVRT